MGLGLLQGVIFPPAPQKQDRDFHFYDYFLKRFIDIIGAIVGLFFAIPLLIIAGTMIKLESRGPIIFSQIRAGVNGKPFRIFKLRTMVTGAENQLDKVIHNNKLKGPEFKIPNEIDNDNSELPPYDTNGRVIPVIGKSPMFIPVFINT